MYDMQIISFDANLSFFMDEFIIYSIYKVIINVFFALNLKICRILRFTIRSYDLQSHLPSTILRKIPILTTLHVGGSWDVISFGIWNFLSVHVELLTILHND